MRASRQSGAGVCRHSRGKFGRALPRSMGQPRRRRTAGERRHLHTRQQRTASMIMSVTLSGCEVIARWEESTSRVSAFLRWAVKRSASGGMALSCRAIRYQDGMVFPAGAPEGSCGVRRATGARDSPHSGEGARSRSAGRARALDAGDPRRRLGYARRRRHEGDLVREAARLVHQARRAVNPSSEEKSREPETSPQQIAGWL